MKSLAILAAATVIASLSTRDIASAGRKCARTPIMFPDAPEPVFVLDRQEVVRAELDGLDRDDIESLFIVCAPDLYDRFKVRAQRSGIVVFTVPGPSAELRAAMERLDAMQREQLRRHGAFTEDLEQLGWSDESGLISVKMEVLDGGTRWKATGSHYHLPARGMTATVSGQRDG